MIEISCPSCGRKLRAKAEWAGRTGKCPKCGQPIRIAADAKDDSPSESSATEAERSDKLQPANEQRLPAYIAPERLNRNSNFIICDQSRIVAIWENNGAGWMLHTSTGLLPVKRNRDKVPTVGQFQLVELKFTQTPEGRRLSGIVCYALGSRWALTALNQGEDAIVEKITKAGCLNRDQKNAVRNEIKRQFMPPVWQDSSEVLAFLANADHQSPGVEVQEA